MMRPRVSQNSAPSDSYTLQDSNYEEILITPSLPSEIWHSISSTSIITRHPPRIDSLDDMVPSLDSHLMPFDERTTPHNANNDDESCAWDMMSLSSLFQLSLIGDSTTDVDSVGGTQQPGQQQHQQPSCNIRTNNEENVHPNWRTIQAKRRTLLHLYHGATCSRKITNCMKNDNFDIRTTAVATNEWDPKEGLMSPSCTQRSCAAFQRHYDHVIHCVFNNPFRSHQQNILLTKNSRNDYCPVPGCRKTRLVWNHYLYCHDSSCLICCVIPQATPLALPTTFRKMTSPSFIVSGDDKHMRNISRPVPMKAPSQSTWTPPKQTRCHYLSPPR